jgi:23S rRNA-intervening sequence protein
MAAIVPVTRPDVCRMALESYRDLEVWQKAQLIVESYRRTDSFPKDERFGLTAQIR